MIVTSILLFRVNEGDDRGSLALQNARVSGLCSVSWGLFIVIDIAAQGDAYPFS